MSQQHGSSSMQRRSATPVLTESTLRAFLEFAPDAVVMIDPDGIIVLVNSQTENLFGYSREELVGAPVETLLPERFRTAHVGHRSGFLTDPRTRPMGADLDLFGRRKDGSEFPVDISLAPLGTEGGLLLAAAIRDVSDRRRADAAKSQLAAIVEYSDDAIIGKDLDGTITSWNRGAQRLYGYTAEEAVGRSISMLAPPDRPDEVPTLLERVRRGEPIDHYETTRLRKDGKAIDLSLRSHRSATTTGRSSARRSWAGTSRIAGVRRSGFDPSSSSRRTPWS